MTLAFWPITNCFFRARPSLRFTSVAVSPFSRPNSPILTTKSGPSIPGAENLPSLRQLDINTGTTNTNVCRSWCCVTPSKDVTQELRNNENSMGPQTIYRGVSFYVRNSRGHLLSLLKFWPLHCCSILPYHWRRLPQSKMGKTAYNQFVTAFAAVGSIGYG